MLDRFNALPQPDAEEQLLACCAAPRWAAEVAGARPYRSIHELTTKGEAAFDRLTPTDLDLVLAAHPRIGQPPTGSGREATWSRREQSGVDGTDPEVRAALADANRRYEERFGHVLLVFATGKSARDILDAARVRLNNDPETERGVVRGELRKIVRLRLERLVAAAGLSTHVLDTARGVPAAGVPVRLQRLGGEDERAWRDVADGRTDHDGRLRDWVPQRHWGAGRYRLIFDTEAYLGSDAFFPDVRIVFSVREPDRHHHVPLLLSPFGYTTYRGS